MIICVRHGETDANAAGLLLGRADPPLAEKGRAHATAVAAMLTGRAGTVARVVSSPLRRCVETAAVIATAAGVDIELDERWIELDYGHLDGTPLAAVPDSLWADWRADIDWLPPGGESLSALGVRVRAACEALIDSAARDDVVVVSHVSPIKAAAAWALGVGDEVAWRMFLSPGSITRLGVVPGRGAVLRSFNETAHLV